MKLHELRPAEGSRRPGTRVGRGMGAGQGKTSGRGQKGQFSRSSVGLPKGFEGGQMPLSQRLPKLRGFHNRFKKQFAVINVGKLNRFEANSVVDADTLRDIGLIGRTTRHGVKVLGEGGLRVSLTLRVHRISVSARAAVEAAGGSVELIGPQTSDKVPRKHRKRGKSKAAAEEADSPRASARAGDQPPAGDPAEETPEETAAQASAATEGVESTDVEDAEGQA